MKYKIEKNERLIQANLQLGIFFGILIGLIIGLLVANNFYYIKFNRVIKLCETDYDFFHSNNFCIDIVGSCG